MKLDEAVTNDEALRRFVQWGLTVLGVAVTDSDDSAFEVPASHRSFFQGASLVQLEYGNAVADADVPRDARPDSQGLLKQTLTGDPSVFPVDELFLTWLMDQLNSAVKVPYAVLNRPTLRVHEISARLFEAYRVEGGRLHLSGCTLEDRPLLRQSWLVPGSVGPPQLLHRFTDEQGTRLSKETVAQLGLNSYKSPLGSLPQLGRKDVRAWCAVASNDPPVSSDGPLPRAPVAVSVVWCQFAAGKIEFVIGEASTEVAFSGWARQLVAGNFDPPPLECPVTKIRSYAIASTDAGQITAQEAIRVCAISGRRVLATELEECEHTGRAVLPEYLATCPVSGQRVLESVLEPCGTCQQSVSPACVEQGVCETCRNLTPVRKDDPRMARVLGEYPRLDRWRNWRIGETSTSYVLVAAALIRRVLVVVNKQSLEIARLATRSRFSSHWAEPPVTERQELLR